MYKYKNILIGLALSHQDGSAIRYAAMLSWFTKPEKITFLHIVSGHNIPEDLRIEYPELVLPIDEYAKDKMEALVKKHFDGYPNAQIDYEVIEGSPLVEFLRLVKYKKIDLIVTRKRKRPIARGTLSELLARMVPCSVFFIPEGAESKINNILVPVDFSENSAIAMEEAIAFASNTGVKELHCLHVYSMPIAYYKTGKTYEQFAEIMKGHAKKNYQKFINKLDLKDIHVYPTFKLDQKASRGIWETTEEHQVDLIIVGARGRRAAAGMLLGSITEQLIRTTSIPLLAVKKKVLGMSILDAILKL